METHQSFGKALTALLAGEENVRISVPGHRSLLVSKYEGKRKGTILIYMIQEKFDQGNWLRAPEILFECYEENDALIAEPVGYMDEEKDVSHLAYSYDAKGQRIGVNTLLKAELMNFTSNWMTTLRGQGFFSQKAKREQLS